MSESDSRLPGLSTGMSAVDQKITGLNKSDLILLAARRPIHGYGIIQEVAEMTGGRVNLGPGTLYGAISTLVDRGWITLYSAEEGSRRKKEYVITDQGRAAFAAELARLRELVRNGEKMEEKP